MHVLIAGGTGFIGARLVKGLLEAGHEVSLVSRSGKSRFDGVKVHNWNPTEGKMDASALDGVDAVINLAGDSIAGGPWTRDKKRSIRDSRVLSTRLLVDAIARIEKRPQVFVSASGAGYYGHTGEVWVDEEKPPGKDFLSGVCAEWENEARRAEALGLRTVRVRTGLTLGQGGFLSPLKWPFRMGLGAVLGNGRQYMSWIHIEDLVNLYLHVLTHETLSEAVNAGAPNPVTNAVFSRTLASTLGRPLFLRVPSPAILILGRSFGRELLLTGQRMKVDKILSTGFTFHYDYLEDALREIFTSSL